jgi:CPA1 family monovalent cation:H+ antiporter
LRGALALALALAIPNTVPEKVAIIVTAFLVVSFSVFVQGLTIPWFAKKLGLVSDPRHQRQRLAARSSD